MERGFLSWSAYIAAFKLLILPKLLYLFRTVPIPLPNWYFSKLNTLLSAFTWNGKEPRCSKHMLNRHKLVGGMGYPNLQDYYYAAILAQTRYWLNHLEDKQWPDLESDFLWEAHFRSYLLMHSNTLPIHLQSNPTFRATLLSWHKLLQHYKSTTQTTTPNISIQALSIIIPDFPSSHWLAKGKSTLQQIMINSTLCPFSGLISPI